MAEGGSTNRWAHGDGGVDPAVAAAYVAQGWWGTDTLADVVARHAADKPEAAAFIVPSADGDPAGDEVFTWADYHHRSTQLAATMAAAGLEPGDRVGVLLPDGPAVHMVLLAASKAGLVAVGIGHRAGDAEVRHLLDRTGATVLVTHAERNGQPAAGFVAGLDRAGVRSLVVPDAQLQGAVLLDGQAVRVPAFDAAAAAVAGRAVGPDDLFMINSTSGTTGLPKCVAHTENRWFYFHQLAAASGELTGEDVFYGAVPAPFGFGQWTSHFTPAILGSPTVVAARFNADNALRAMERLHVTVLSCVSTQFIMMLNSPVLHQVDLSALRAMYTGGEAVPYERAAAFEDLTGAVVLQFYGSNETGTFSYTTLADTRERRLRTAGKVIEAMQVRVYGPDGQEVTGPVRTGVPAGRGPATCLGYLDDDAANAELLTEDRWMLMGDIVEIDQDGYLRVVGRTSDIIIRGGKNISAPAVEAELAEHADVAMVAAVAMPDEVFGERVCVYVVSRSGERLTLADLTDFLAERGVSKEWFPERVVQMDELPMSSGGKVAKGELRADIRRRLEAEQPT
ncbi:MAG TPA: class I adenylate-forming enzyme family protein [Acidimicrobiales bacterium]|nr:class I adenylate-forming enzyme family protein [Acidimicrobiales bacterium]